MKRSSSPLLLAVLLWSLAFPARAIELSLEENRAERGSVGYVDMQRLFKSSPDAARAREGLEELVRQAEERVNTRKAALLGLRQSLSALKIERDELAKSTPTAPAPLSPPAPPPAAPPATPTPASPTPMAPVTEAPPAAPASTQAATAPLTANLPGLTQGPLNLGRPGGSPLDPSRDRTPPPPAEPAAAAAPARAPAPGSAPAPVPPPQPAGPTVAQRLIELDGRIVGKQVELDRLQAELDGERQSAEKSLVGAEGRKTDQVLARLYRAISEVARREGVSVVVDKAATLYGHPAVDLTDKILKQLKGPAAQP